MEKLKQQVEMLLRCGYKPKLVANMLNISMKRLNSLVDVNCVKGENE